MPNHSIIHGDCLEELKKMLEKSVDVVNTSPPYNFSIKYSEYKDNKPFDEYLEWLGEISKEIKRVMKDDGSFFFNFGFKVTASSVPFIVCNKIQEIFELQNTIIWVKAISLPDDTSIGNFKPITSDKYLNNNFEYIFHFTKNCDVKLDKLALGVPYMDKKNETRFKNGFNSTKKVKDKRDRGNIWFIPYETKSFKEWKEKNWHPAPFPTQLAANCIKLHGIKEEMMVLDPFLGSGTTLVAAKQLAKEYNINIKSFGIELDKKYCIMAEQWINSIN